MGTPSTPLEIKVDCPGLPIPGPLRPAGPGGGGAFFPSRANIDDEESLPEIAPSSPPLCELTLGACPYRVVRTYAQLLDFPNRPTSSQVLDDRGRAVWCGLYASVEAPGSGLDAGPWGIVTVGNGEEFEAFRLVWTRPSLLGQNARCGPELGWAFELQPAGAVFKHQADGGLANLGTGQLVARTELSGLAPSLVNAVDPRPWAWQASFRVVESPEDSVVPVQNATLVAALCEAAGGCL